MVLSASVISYNGTILEVLLSSTFWLLELQFWKLYPPLQFSYNVLWNYCKKKNLQICIEQFFVELIERKSKIGLTFYVNAFTLM